MFGGRGSAEGEMRRLTDDTGGRTFRVDRRNSLTEIYNQLQEELRSQYVIAYTPTNPDRTAVSGRSKSGSRIARN